jgi:rhodanese-related sulfurtransferase
MLTPWIQNVSLADIKKGHHIEAGINSMLIQIVDPDMDFPIPAKQFKETHQFKFLDLEKTDDCINDKWKISDAQAEKLVALLQHALDNQMTVVVHCHAGVCRSGAVAEVGTIMGFRDAEAFRSPNLLVKHKMMKVLGLTYDEKEPHTINGIIVPEDWNNDNEKVFTLATAKREFREREGDI